jgi:integrase
MPFERQQAGSRVESYPASSAHFNNLLEREWPVIEQVLESLAGDLLHLAQCLAGRRDGEGSSYPAVRPSSNLADVAQIVDELLQGKGEDGLSSRYIETLRSHLGRFATSFEQEITSIKTAQIEQWLRAQDIGLRARNNIRASVVTLFHFARSRGYLPKGVPTEADDVAKAKDRGSAIGILTPLDLDKVLRQAAGNVRLFLALGAFTGMRSSEILQLDWRDLNFDRAFITVAAHKAKTATRRLVPIQPNLSHWLTPVRLHSGSLFRSRRDAARAIAFAKSCDVVWPNNCLRHSYATYRLSLTADAARVALEMGNSPQKLMTNYRELADERQAQAWFSIAPARPKNIISVSRS